MDMNKLIGSLMITLILILGLLVGFGMSVNKELNEANLDLTNSLNEKNEVVKEVIVEKEVIKEVEIEVIRNVTVTIPIDNKNLDIVMQFIEDEVDEDLDVSYIIFEQEAKDIAEEYINEEITDLLDDEDFFDDTEVLEDYRKSEISIKKIYDVKILDRDFDDQDLELSYEVKVRAKEDGEDKEYFMFEVVLSFEDGEFQDEDSEISLI